MKYLISVLALFLLVSCTYNDIGHPICYLQSEFLNGVIHTYGYNDKNQLIADTYPGDNAVMGYDAHGNVVSESDYPDIQITYTYNDKNQLTLMDGSSATYSDYAWQIKYSYNSSGQLVRVETWQYGGAANSFYLEHYDSLGYPTSSSKNYSTRKGYYASNDLAWTLEYEWDAHPNPHLKNPYFTNEPPPANNITSIKYTPAGGPTLINNYTYIYNSNGFPVKQLHNGNVANTYTYTNCN